MRAGGGISGVRCRRRSVTFSAELSEGWGNGEGRGGEGRGKGTRTRRCS